MDTIASFLVNHDLLEPGIYLSRIDGDVVTYDMRFVKPNCPPYMDNAALHTFEHLFATIARNSEFGANIIYFGPMGCRTGFYLLTRGMSHRDAIELMISAAAQIAAWNGAIPGAASSAECGNWLEHDLDGAKALAKGWLHVVRCWTQDMLEYKL